jgi:reactive intermediate/imine deaminase
MDLDYVNIRKDPGNYSSAVVAGDICYVSGVVSMDLVTYEMIEGDVEAQLRQIFTNIDTIVQAAGFGDGAVIQYTCYLTDIDDWPTLNKVFADYVSSPPPARVAVAVQGLPLKAKVEISCIVARNTSQK